MEQTVLTHCLLPSTIPFLQAAHKMEYKSLASTLQTLKAKGMVDRLSGDRWQTTKCGRQALKDIESHKAQQMQDERQRIKMLEIQSVIEKTKQAWDGRASDDDDEIQLETFPAATSDWCTQLRLHDGDTSVMSQVGDGSRLEDVVDVALSYAKRGSLSKLSVVVNGTHYRFVPKQLDDGWSVNSERKLKIMSSAYAESDDSTAFFFVQQDALCSMSLFLNPTPEQLQHYLLANELCSLSDPDVSAVLTLDSPQNQNVKHFHEVAKNLNAIKAIYTIQELKAFLQSIL